MSDVIPVYTDPAKVKFVAHRPAPTSQNTNDRVAVAIVVNYGGVRYRVYAERGYAFITIKGVRTWIDADTEKRMQSVYNNEGDPGYYGPPAEPAAPAAPPVPESVRVRFLPASRDRGRRIQTTMPDGSVRVIGQDRFLTKEERREYVSRITRVFYRDAIKTHDYAIEPIGVDFIVRFTPKDTA